MANPSHRRRLAAILLLALCVSWMPGATAIKDEDALPTEVSPWGGPTCIGRRGTGISVTISNCLPDLP